MRLRHFIVCTYKYSDLVVTLSLQAARKSIKNIFYAGVLSVMQKQTLLLLFCLVSITLTLVSGSLDRERPANEGEGKAERVLRQIQNKRRMRNALLKKLAKRGKLPQEMCSGGRWAPVYSC